MKAKVHVTLKNGVLDPEGKAVQHALEALGFAGINEIRKGKFIEIDLVETNSRKAHERIDAMCRQLLANTVIENYSINIVD